MAAFLEDGIVVAFLGGRNTLFHELNATVNRANLAARIRIPTELDTRFVGPSPGMA
ncbi:MAG: hypothetical protein HYX75_05840 [Acidobacteria bacterium]|nr:hypothetical protein [Acidobacteriota bacterium]